MIKREMEPVLKKLAGQLPVVFVTGPRQSGKTTLCQMAFPELDYVSLEPLDSRDFAREDPRGFLSQHRDGAVFDEVQRAPELLPYLQEEVDQDPTPGRFILTGSQHFVLSESISQSLAGRVGILHLLPPSLDELLLFDSPPTDLWTTLWMGAFPRIHDRKLDADRWLADYVTTYVQRDVRQILAVGDLDAFTLFVRLMAGSTAQELNLSRLGSDAGISHNTARFWLSVLETSFLALRVPAWHRNIRKQAVKAPKIHLLDSGLACHLLGIRSPDQLLLHPLRGALFESWVVCEVYKSRAHRGLPPDLFHFRDAKGLEVDLLLEDGDRVIAVEAKSGATVAPDWFGGLRRLGEILRKTSPHLHMESCLVYGGDQAQHRTDVAVLPWRVLPDADWGG